MLFLRKTHKKFLALQMQNLPDKLSTYFLVVYTIKHFLKDLLNIQYKQRTTQSKYNSKWKSIYRKTV